ncbi:MAG: DUF1906 domain-containing protein [Solirubrobacterales bacterium]|nr:DUF1906 domain-containing protein [Solirubrobacterales bacterium]
MFEGRMGGIRRLRGPAAIGVLLPCAALVGSAAALAQTPAGARTVRYHGLSVRLPRSWQVFNLARDPHACVRFDRHALYLGTPGPAERCPARSIGRTEAILIAPAKASPSAPNGTAVGLGLEGDATTFAVTPAGVDVTATWRRAPGLVAHALGRTSLPRTAQSPLPAASSSVAIQRAAGGETTAHTARAASIFTGLGFDTCSAPSQSQMAAWSVSPYRAVGIYIGGVNMGCAQPNLSRTWISREIAAGWHPFPIYVGPQAPNNLCGCLPMSSNTSQANAAGRAAASDAVTQARHFGIFAGNPVYFDMEGYATGPPNSPAVLAFLAGWTAGLHAARYLSGIYSSAGSGISDLVSKYGTGYLEPNDIWIADWNGRQSGIDPVVPHADWPRHQRLHQYSGNVSRTFGGVTLVVDEDYANGATLGRSQRSRGYLLLTSDGGVHEFGHAVLYGSDLGGLPPRVRAVALAKDRDTGGYWILTSNGGVDNFHAPWDGSMRGKLRGRRAVGLVQSPKGGYLILTSDGGVHPFDAGWHGSDAHKLRAGVTAVGIAIDRETGGYRILKSNGGVDTFHAPFDGSLQKRLRGRHAVGLAPARAGGYFILTANGGVHNFGPSHFYGSDAGKLPRGVKAVSLATCPTVAGYRILRTDGGVDTFAQKWFGGLAGLLPARVRAVGIAAAMG